MDEIQLKMFLVHDFEKAASENCTKLKNATWDYLTDLLNLQKQLIFQQSAIQYTAFIQEYWEKYFKNLTPSNYQDEKIKRQLVILKHVSEAATQANASDLWAYESPDLFKEIDNLWKQVRPLYLDFHIFVGRKFGNIIFGPSNGRYPARVFINKRTQNWIDFIAMITPYPEASRIDINAALQEQNFTILKMYQTADEFYKSMGLLPSAMSYDVSKGAIIEQPTNGRKILCPPISWDFCNHQDYRISMCTQICTEDFFTIHHQLGLIQYFLQYSHQPYVFRHGANPGFPEAIGGTIVMSAMTPKHLQKINLLSNYKDNQQSSINFLMIMALKNIAFLSFGVLREGLSVYIENRNVKFDTNNALDDPPIDSAHIAHFVAHILQFQIYKSLCIVAGEYDPKNKKVPLHQCDFYESKEAGRKLSDGMALGSSENWHDVFEKMTGEREMDASALLEYFQPLHTFLKEENGKSQNNVGTMGSTIYFVFVMEIVVLLCYSYRIK